MGTKAHSRDLGEKWLGAGLARTLGSLCQRGRLFFVLNIALDFSVEGAKRWLSVGLRLSRVMMSFQSGSSLISFLTPEAPVN
jgi:hypothetical protein